MALNIIGGKGAKAAAPAPEGRLGPDQRKALARRERAIRRGARAFIRVRLALMEVRDRRLYREQFALFEDYCRARFDLAPSHSCGLIAEAQAVIGLQEASPIREIANEAQARVPRALRRQVLHLALELAEGGELHA